ncbi:heat shock factor-binding protein 1-like [Suncus etruscus]|uniref:heat shock factor-binding protein 1-like n=1 Tax=Suncus etruscus TaxID=109475 RepID=UPI0021101ED5|nr:heat shock factor-binding protein 1-like [Suncus etruscus]
MTETDPKTVQDLSSVVQALLQQMQDKFQIMSDQIIGRIDDMSSRIDDLEKNIADLMTQAGVEELEGDNKLPATQKWLSDMECRAPFLPAKGAPTGFCH